MFKKTALLISFGAGYVLGARAGRERYRQIVGTAEKMWHDPRVQQKADQARDVAKEKADQARDVAKQKTDQATDAAKEKAASASDSVKHKMPDDRSTDTGSASGSHSPSHASSYSSTSSTSSTPTPGSTPSDKLPGTAANPASQNPGTGS